MIVVILVFLARFVRETLYQRGAVLPFLADPVILIPYSFHPLRAWQVCLVQRRTGSRYGRVFRSGRWSAKSFRPMPGPYLSF